MSWIAIIIQIFDTNKGINTRENIICRILPKHLLNCVCLSMKTFAEMTFPNGRNVETRSVSLNSCGRWYINKLQPSGPSICLSVLVNFAFWAAAAAAAAAAVNAGNPESRKIRHHRFSYSSSIPRFSTTISRVSSHPTRFALWSPRLLTRLRLPIIGDTTSS